MQNLPTLLAAAQLGRYWCSINDNLPSSRYDSLVGRFFTATPTAAAPQASILAVDCGVVQWQDIRLWTGESGFESLPRSRALPALPPPR
jgi:hypothetical protein